MPIPAPQTEFLPEVWHRPFVQYARNEAWYVGDQTMLQAAYPADNGAGVRVGTDAAHHYTGRGNTRKDGLRGFLSRFFNGVALESTEGNTRTRLHVPIWANVSAMSAEQMLSEPANFRQVSRLDGKTIKGPAQRRTDEILNGERTRMALIEAAEITAGLGAVALTAHWNPAESDAPWMQHTACDAVLPEFEGARLVAANLFTRHRVVSGPAGIITGEYVHIERHERGQIVHVLLKMQGTRIERPVPLGSIDDALGLSLGRIPLTPGSRWADVEHAVALPTGIEALTVSWWRNRPTKTFRRGSGPLAFLGRADLEGPGELLVDAADEVWSSLVRDVRIARARLIVPEQLLEQTADGPAFDDARELLTGLSYTSLRQNDETISAHQFAIRSEEHLATFRAHVREIVGAAGWSESSYAESEGSGVTATEVVDRTTKSERTRARKALHMRHGVVPISEALLQLDAVHYRGEGMAATSRLEMAIPEVSHIDPEKQARALSALRSVQLISIETGVRLLHDDWDEQEQAAEVRRLMLEAGELDEQDGAAADREEPETPEERAEREAEERAEAEAAA